MRIALISKLNIAFQYKNTLGLSGPICMHTSCFLSITSAFFHIEVDI